MEVVRWYGGTEDGTVEGTEDGTVEGTVLGASNTVVGKTDPNSAFMPA